MRSSLGARAECYFYHILSAVLSLYRCVCALYALVCFCLFCFQIQRCTAKTLLFSIFIPLSRLFRSPCMLSGISRNAVHLIFHLPGIHPIYEKFSKLWSSIIVSINCIPEKHQSRHAKFLPLCHGKKSFENTLSMSMNRAVHAYRSYILSHHIACIPISL